MNSGGYLQVVDFGCFLFICIDMVLLVNYRQMVLSKEEWRRGLLAKLKFIGA